MTGKVLPDGEKGELVFTTLTKEGMPVIRYRTRDLTRLLPGTRVPCAHGEDHRRSDDMMMSRRQRVPTQIEEMLLKIEPLSAHYQVVLTREGRMDEMEVVVEFARRPRPLRTGRSRQCTAGRIKDPIGVTAKVSVVDPSQSSDRWGRPSASSISARRAEGEPPCHALALPITT